MESDAGAGAEGGGAVEVEGTGEEEEVEASIEASSDCGSSLERSETLTLEACLKTLS